MDRVETADRLDVRSQEPPTARDIIRLAEIANAECRFDEADEMFRDAIARHPKSLGLAGRFALAAITRGDWRAAAERAADARARFPMLEVGYVHGIRAAFELDRLNEATALQQEAEQRFSEKSWPLFEGARLAEAREDGEGAQSHLERARERSPAHPEAWLELARFMSRAGRFEAADQTIGEAMLRFADEPSLHMLHAEIAGTFGFWRLARERWEAANSRFPGHPEIGLRHANAPAEAVLDKQWDVALSRHVALRERFPAFAGGLRSHIALLRRAGRPEAAAELAKTAAPAFLPLGNHLALGIEIAKLREARGHSDEALAMLRALVDEAPNATAPYMEWSGMLARRERLDEAEAVCERAIARFKFRVEPYAEHAKLAARRGDNAGALARWKLAAAASPRNGAVRLGLFVSRLSMAGDADESKAAVDAAGEAGEGSLSRLMHQFESLGGPVEGGCEFGLVQRYFRAEPMGLLRWTSIETSQLIHALRLGFEGLGEPERSLLEMPLAGEHNYRYHVRDSVFGMRFHTFVSKGEVPEETLLERWRQQLKYMRRKFIRDLETSDKIFVYRPDARLSAAEIDALAVAMRRYGDGKLLIVQVENAEHRNGTVSFVLPNVIIGYIDRLNWSPEGLPRTPSYASWARLCLEARALCDGAS